MSVWEPFIFCWYFFSHSIFVSLLVAFFLSRVYWFCSVHFMERNLIYAKFSWTFLFLASIWNMKSSNERATAALTTSTAKITSINIKKLGPYYHIHTHTHPKKYIRKISKNGKIFPRMNPIRHVQGNTKLTFGMRQTDRQNTLWYGRTRFLISACMLLLSSDWAKIITKKRKRK